ncbi:uncharacterized protein LOC135350548 [Halichondria panicea]|uniref:uncharacterized protein LOC135350548 n=1 Tax=Halichondria panicea TaxID=6063 RepID=UPI00312BB9DC
MYTIYSLRKHTKAMDRYLSPSTQRERKNEQLQQVSSHSPSAQHTNKSPLIVSIPRSIREQHITDTASNDPRETHAEQEQSKQSHSDINSQLARKRLHTRTRGKQCQPSFTLQGASPSTTPPAKRVHPDSPQQLAGSSRQYESDDTCTEQYESDNSDSETDHHTSQRHSIASSNQTTPAGSQYLHFNEMYQELYEVSTKWYNLGLALGLAPHTLNIIKHNNKDDCETCLREALEQRDNNTNLTWEEIDKALRQPTVQMIALANNIQEKVSTKSLSTSSSQPSSDPTPECVVRYTSFLKDRYKKMLPFPDDWPPPLRKKFTKLALIERNKQIRLTQAKHQSSIQYDYATGNVDNIVERKKAITLEQIFEPISGDFEIAAPNRYTVVMDGAPGVGKTTLSRKMCIDWAQGKLIIKDHQGRIQG